MIIVENRQDLPDIGNSDMAVSYIHDSRNLGISTAYNFAFKQAKERMTVSGFYYLTTIQES